MSLTKAHVAKIFDLVAPPKPDWEGFFAYVKDDVDWTISNANIKSTPVAGRYDKKGFQAAVAPLIASFKDPLSLKTERITLEGNVASIELRSQNVGIKDGKTFDNSYVWIVEFEDGPSEPKITLVKEYFDSALHAAFLKNNVGLEI